MALLMQLSRYPALSRSNSHAPLRYHVAAFPARPFHTISTRESCVRIASSLPQHAEIEGVPWGIGFQCNERFLEWDKSASLQLIKLTLSSKLNLSMDEVGTRIEELGILVPDLTGKLERMRCDILLPLIQDPAATTNKLLGLKALLPGVNISMLVSRWPYILLDFSLDDLKERIAQMKEELPGVRVEGLIDVEPMMLKADLVKVIANIERLMPGQDPYRILAAQPQMVLDMAQAGMLSAADVEGSPSVK